MDKLLYTTYDQDKVNDLQEILGELNLDIEVIGLSSIDYAPQKSYSEEKAEFWLKKMTDKISRITKELNSKQDFLWCFKNGDAFPVNFSKIALIQVEEEKTKIYTADNIYLYKARLYQVKNLLPHEFIAVSRGAIINYHQLDHLQILNNGNIDAILTNKIRVQVSRRRIKDLKERLGL